MPRAVLVFPEAPTPARSGNTWRDLQQVQILRKLGYAVHVIAVRRRWDLGPAQEAESVQKLGTGFSYLTDQAAEPSETRLKRLSRKLSYVVGGRRRHPFGWWLPGGLEGAVAALVSNSARSDVLLLRSIFIHTLPALRRVWQGRIVIDCHDADVELAREMLKTVRGLGRLGPWANCIGTRRAVARYLPLADEVWTVSPEDAGRIRDDAPNVRLVVVPSGMDGQRAASAAQPGVDSHVLLVANFGYGPNARGAEWLLRDVWPLVRAQMPVAVLRCVGGRVPKALSEIAVRTRGVEFLGQVTDISDVMAGAGVIVVPILEGAGTRLKIVDAWSQGKAVVSTSKGVEGLPWVESVAAVADDPAVFGARVIDLMIDRPRRTAMGTAALELFRGRLSWDVVAQIVAEKSIIMPTAPERVPDHARS